MNWASRVSELAMATEGGAWTRAGRGRLQQTVGNESFTVTQNIHYLVFRNKTRLMEWHDRTP